MAAEWEPTPDQVKGLIPTRATGGPFSTQTKPTLDQVAGYIEGVVSEVEAEVGAIPDDESLQRQANWAAALGAAYYVEQGLFPEQQSEGGTADRLYDRYQAQLARLRRSITDFGQSASRQTVGTVRTPSATALGLERYLWDR